MQCFNNICKHKIDFPFYQTNCKSLTIRLWRLSKLTWQIVMSFVYKTDIVTQIIDTKVVNVFFLNSSNPFLGGILFISILQILTFRDSDTKWNNIMKSLRDLSYIITKICIILFLHFITYCPLHKQTQRGYCSVCKEDYIMRFIPEQVARSVSEILL